MSTKGEKRSPFMQVDKPFEAEVSGRKTTVDAGHRIQVAAWPDNPEAKLSFQVLGIRAQHTAFGNVVDDACTGLFES